MNDKQLTTNESLELISRMIENTRRNFSDRGGTMFLIWGYTTISVTVMIYFTRLMHSDSPLINLIWLVLPVIGGILTWREIRNQKRTTSVTTHLDKTINQIWVVFLVPVAICMIYSFIRVPVFIDILFTIGLSIGIAAAISGLVIKSKITAFCGFLGIVIAFLIPLFEGINELFVFLALVVCTMIVPGHALNRAYKKGGGRDV